MMISEDNQRQSRSELQTLISSMSKTKRIGIRRTPRFRFRATVRTVINNLKWLIEEPPGVKKELTKGPKLTMQIKGLLRTDVEERTADDKAYLFKVIGNLTCLQRYPEKIKQNLTSSAIFMYFGPNRVLVAEGQPAEAMYFIVSGEASVTQMMYDPGENKMRGTEVGTMSAGDSFGETNILHDEPWPTTVTTITHIELLRVLKKHFQQILEEFLGEQKEEITRCLNKFPYFQEWSQRTIVECCILSRVQKFPKDTVILGDKVGNSEYAYFIVSGECTVMYHLVAKEDGSFQFDSEKASVMESNDEDTFPMSKLMRGLEMNRMRRIGDPHIVHLIVDRTLRQLIDELPYPDAASTLGDEIEKEVPNENRFFRIAVLMVGQCFGIGECLENKFIVSNSDSLFLLEIPRHFLKLHNRGNIWGRVREFFNLMYPSPRAIYNKFVMERKWQKCRKQYLESILKVDRPFTGLTSAEQPYYDRMFKDILNPMFLERKVRIKAKKTE